MSLRVWLHAVVQGIPFSTTQNLGRTDYLTRTYGASFIHQFSQLPGVVLSANDTLACGAAVLTAQGLNELPLA